MVSIVARMVKLPQSLTRLADDGLSPMRNTFWPIAANTGSASSRSAAEPLDADAAGQATFYCCFDKFGCEEGERDGHVDLPNAAFLESAKLCDRGHST